MLARKNSFIAVTNLVAMIILRRSSRMCSTVMSKPRVNTHVKGSLTCDSRELRQLQPLTRARKI
jgi:hypothetical protein